MLSRQHKPAATPQAKGAFDGPITATQNALDAAKKDAAAKDAAAKSTTTTPGTTTGGGVEDKVKAAEAAKATANRSGGSTECSQGSTSRCCHPQAKGAFDGPISQRRRMLWMQPRRMLLIRRPLQKVQQQRQEQQQAVVSKQQQQRWSRR